MQNPLRECCPTEEGDSPHTDTCVNGLDIEPATGRPRVYPAESLEEAAEILYHAETSRDLAARRVEAAREESTRASAENQAAQNGYYDSLEVLRLTAQRFMQTEPPL